MMAAKKKAAKKPAKKAAKKKVAKKKAKSTISKLLAPNLLHMSEYLQELLAPETHYGCKIPDPDTSLSFTAHCIQRVQPAVTSPGPSATSAVGVAMFVGSLGVASLPSGYDYAILTPTGTADNLLFTPAVKSYASILTNKLTLAQRPVSASLTCSYNGSTQTDQGRFIVGFLPGPYFTATSTYTFPSITSLLTFPFISTFPAARRFGRVRYLPTDALTLCYNNTGNGNFPLRTIAGAQYGWLFIIIDGAQVNNMAEFTMTENYEAIPALNAVNLISSTPSKSDPIELSMVSNALAKKPQISVEQAPQQTLAGTAVVQTPMSASPVNTQAPPIPKSEETFFERILNGVEKYGPLVARGAELVGSLL